MLAGGGLLVFSVVAALVVVGIDDSQDADGEAGRASQARHFRSRPTADPATAHGESSAPSRLAGADRDPGVGLGPAVSVEADDGETFPASYDVADGLAPVTVLRMRVTGFAFFVRAVAEQCSTDVSDRCANRVPVQFDAEGQARFQYLVTDDFLAPRAIPGRCRANAAPCTVVVWALEGADHGEIQTVFGTEVPPPGRIVVTPANGLSLDGETVKVEVHDYPPGAELKAMVCAAPDATGARCGRPGPEAPMVIGVDGTGRTQLRVEPGRVGSARARCARGNDCGVSVASREIFARAPVVPISFAAPPGAAYDPTRRVLGLGLALVLFVIAATVLVRSDWSAVGEASAPEIDDVDYADLDAIIAALPPEGEEVSATR